LAYGELGLQTPPGIEKPETQFVPTTAPQAANSAVRFSAYTSVKQYAEGFVAPGEKLGTISNFCIGGIAGIVTVYKVPHLESSWRMG
jgi:solute carrier family 25 (mitochondrial citrate transporter), member 1